MSVACVQPGVWVVFFVLLAVFMQICTFKGLVQQVDWI